MKIPLYIEVDENKPDFCSLFCPFLAGRYCNLFNETLAGSARFVDQDGIGIPIRSTECLGFENEDS